jgi:peroxiredoxin
MKKAVSVLVVLFMCVAGFAQPSVGEKASEISLPDTKGSNLSLSSLQGKVVLIDFWASWCGPCRRSEPELKKLYEKYQSKGFEIYGISVDEDKFAWKTAIKQDKINWLHVNDDKGVVAGKWNVMYIPNTYLLDKTGKVVAVNPSHQQLDELIQKLLL